LKFIQLQSFADVSAIDVPKKTAAVAERSTKII